MSRHTSPCWLSLAAAALTIATVAGCSAASAASPGGPAPIPGAIKVTINSAACGAGVPAPAPGWRTFQVYNDSTASGEVDLIDPASGAVYGEIEPLGPGTSDTIRLDMGSGAYAFRCLLDDTDTVTGPVIHVPGHARGTRAVLPITTDDLLPIANEYHGYVTDGLVTLVQQVTLLDAKIKAGDLAAARTAWLPAHLTYERLGAAYDTFGNYDTTIDGRADGLAGGVNSPDFTGFYRLEYGLWHGQSAAELTSPAARLLRNVLALQKAWPAMEIDLLNLGLRTHEILENALEFQLSGHDDYGSGTTLATTAENITGTRELLSILHPLLVTRYKDLPAVYTWLDRLNSLLNQNKRPNGHPIPVTQLSTSSREQIDSACSQALEELAPIAAITEPRIT